MEQYIFTLAWLIISLKGATLNVCQTATPRLACLTAMLGSIVDLHSFITVSLH